MFFVEKKKKIALLILAALFSFCCLFLAFFVGNRKAAADSSYDVENRVMYMLASPGEKYSITYFDTEEDVVLTFDYVLEVKAGYFGLFFGKSATYSDSTCFMTGKNGEKKGIDYTGDFRFERGYSYKAGFSSTENSLSVFRKKYTADASGYTLVAKLDLPDTYTKVGVIVVSATGEQAYALVDNFGISTASLSANFVNTFNGTTGVTAYGIKVASSGGNITANYGIPEAYYNAKFMSADMSVISNQKVAVFNYATAPEAPVVAGCEFMGWSIDYTAAAYTDNTDTVIITPIYKTVKSIDELCYDVTEYGVSLLAVNSGDRSVLVNSAAAQGRYIYLQYTVGASSLSRFFGFSGVGVTNNQSVTYFAQNGYMGFRNFEQSLFEQGSTYRLIFDRRADSFTYRAYKVTEQGLTPVVSDFSDVAGTYVKNSSYAGITIGISEVADNVQLTGVKCYDEQGNDLGIKTTGSSTKTFDLDTQKYFLCGHTFAIYNSEPISGATHLMLDFKISESANVSFDNTLIGWFGNSDVTSEYGYIGTYGFLNRDDDQTVSGILKAGDKIHLVVVADGSSDNGAIYVNGVAQSFTVKKAKTSSDISKCKYYGFQIMNKSSSDAVALAGVLEDVRIYAYNGTTGLTNDLGVEITTQSNKIAVKTSEAVSMVNGAAIRLVSPMGLGFATKVNKSVYAKLSSIYGANNLVTGTIILPTAYLEEGAKITHAYLDEHDIQYKDIANTGWRSENSTDYFFRGSLIVAERNYGNEFSAVGYVGIVTGDSVVYIYTVYDEENNSRSAAFVADASLSDLSEVATDKYCYYVDDGAYKGYSPYTLAQRAEMAKYLG